MIGNFNTLDVQVPQEIVHYWGWLLAFGVALLLIGVVAIVRSVTVTIVSMLFFGWLLALASGIEVVQAIMVGHWAGFFQPLGGGSTLWSDRFYTCDETGAQRRSRYDAYGSVLPCERIVSVYWLNMGCVARLGLASGGRNCWACSFLRNGLPQDSG